MSVIVVLAGGAILETSQTEATLETAVLAMSEVDGHIDSLSTGIDSSKSVSFERLSDKGGLEVSDNGTFRVVVNDTSTSGVIVDETTQLGKIVFERDGKTVAYQAGGVWRSGGEGNASVMVSPPKFEYQYRQGEPTLTLPLINVTGNASDSDVSFREVRSESLFPSGGTNNPLSAGENVTLEVKSEYYTAWGELFESRTNGAVTYDHSNRTAAVELTGAQVANVSASIETPAALYTHIPGTLNVDNNAQTGSYDSSSPPVTFSGDRGDVLIEGDYNTSGPGSDIQGRVVATGSSVLDNDQLSPQVIGNNATFGGDPSKETVIKGYHEINGSLSTQSNLSVIGKNETLKTSIYGNVLVGGNVTDFENVYVDGDVYITGNLESYGPNVTVTGTIYIEGENNDRFPPPGGPSLDPSVRDVRDPRTPTMPSRDSQNTVIANKGTSLAADNDNAAAGSTIADISNTAPGICDPCTLTAGKYYIPNGLDLQSEKLILDTTGGPIEIYAEKGPIVNAGMYVKNSNVTILGPNPVEVYTPGDFELVETGSSYHTEIVTRPQPYRAPNFKLFVRDNATARLNNQDGIYTGVLYGPGDGGGADLTVTNNVTVYGAVVGDLGYFNSNAKIYFDESLTGGGTVTTADTNSGSTVRFVHVTTRTIAVEG